MQAHVKQVTNLAGAHLHWADNQYLASVSMQLSELFLLSEQLVFQHLYSFAICSSSTGKNSRNNAAENYNICI